MKPGFGKIKEKTNQMLGGVKGAFQGEKKIITIPIWEINKWRPMFVKLLRN